MRLTYPWFISKLPLFSAEQRVMLVSMVTKEAFEGPGGFTQEERNRFMLLFSYLTSESTQTSIDSVYDYCREVFLEGKGPYIFVINEGEDGKITETRADTTPQYTGYIVVREDSTNSKITDSVSATSAFEHDLPYTNFPLAKGGIYRLRVQLEKNLTGDATVVLSTAYVVVPMKVDKVASSSVTGTLINSTPIP